MPLLLLTRDSVCAGDDGDAPHARTWPVAEDARWEEVLTAIAQSGYLASIAGGQASWVAQVDGRPVAVLAQQWAAPRLLPAPAKTRVVAGQALHFIYEVQRDPEALFAALAAR